MSNVSALYHIVINTKNRQMTIPETHKRDLYKYIYGVVLNYGSKLLRMNGIGNHIHLLVDMAATVSIAALVAEIKRTSSLWLKQNPNFPNFDGWGREYYAATISRKQVPSVVEYIKGQENHHLKCAFEDEFRQMVLNIGNSWNEHMLT